MANSGEFWILQNLNIKQSFNQMRIIILKCELHNFDFIERKMNNLEFGITGHSLQDGKISLGQDVCAINIQLSSLAEMCHTMKIIFEQNLAEKYCGQNKQKIFCFLNIHAYAQQK